jgi:ABC-type phosphate/phosphonate transport system substrate-binding protein
MDELIQNNSNYMRLAARDSKPGRSVRDLHFFTSLAYLFVLLLLLSLAKNGMAKELDLAVNLGLSPTQATERYKPLIRYLGKVTGQRVRLHALPNAFAHWEMMRRKGFELVLDNPAFTAYRASKMNYTVIGKLPDVLSFTLVTHVDEMMFEPEELIGHKVASLPSPSITALRLNEIYANPMRQPNFLNVSTHAEALQLVVKGRVDGAMVPTGMISNLQSLNPIYTTRQIPAPGFSASDTVSPELRDKIRRALLDADKTDEGRAMLESLNVARFETATNATYAGMERMLEGLYGY